MNSLKIRTQTRQEHGEELLRVLRSLEKPRKASPVASNPQIAA